MNTSRSLLDAILLLKDSDKVVHTYHELLYSLPLLIKASRISYREIALEMCMSLSTLRYKIKNPDSLTKDELIKLIDIIKSRLIS